MEEKEGFLGWLGNAGSPSVFSNMYMSGWYLVINRPKGMISTGKKRMMNKDKHEQGKKKLLERELQKLRGMIEEKDRWSSGCWKW